MSKCGNNLKKLRTTIRLAYVILYSFAVFAPFIKISGSFLTLLLKTELHHILKIGDVEIIDKIVLTNGRLRLDFSIWGSFGMTIRTSF